MTIEEANIFLNNLKVCIEEHPIVADWLVEIADRPQADCSKCKWWSKYGYCVHLKCKGFEPQTERSE